jgi:hypothetical protein
MEERYHRLDPRLGKRVEEVVVVRDGRGLEVAARLRLELGPFN